jgi:predicted SAM-dependent methyltransferase
MVNKIIPHEDKPFKLDLGCGDRKEEGFFGIDIVKTEAADYVFDLTEFPYPIDDGVVDEIVCNHFFEHLTGAQRIKFMEECYRIMKKDSKLTIVVPYWSSMRAIQDPTHQWPPVCEASFLYFNKKWMKDNKLEHYNINCDFDYSYGYALDNDLLVRNMDWQQFAVKHYIQAVNDLQVTLTKR